MTRITIIPSDSFCSVDGVGYRNIDMSSINPTIHAVQWYTDHGWVEYKPLETGEKQDNQWIDSIDAFQLVLEAWQEADYAEKNPPPPPPPTAEQNKSTASMLLAETDYTQLVDVIVLNKAEFDIYRAQLREIVINPQAGVLEWPVKPSAVWS
jgi:hypothetical protein